MKVNLDLDQSSQLLYAGSLQALIQAYLSGELCGEREVGLYPILHVFFHPLLMVLEGNAQSVMAGVFHKAMFLHYRSQWETKVSKVRP